MVRRSRHHPTETRTAILEAARQLFDTVGYDATTMGAVAAAAGMSTANVYKHFPRKMAVLHALAEGWLCDIEARLGRSDTGRPVRDELCVVVGQLVAAFSEAPSGSPQLIELLSATLFDQPPFVPEFKRRIAARIANVIASGIARGELAANDPFDAAEDAMGALYSVTDPLVFLRRLHLEPDMDVDQVVRRSVDFVVAALKSPLGA